MKKVIGKIKCWWRGKCKRFNGVMIDSDLETITMMGTCKDCGRRIIKRVKRSEIKNVQIIQRFF